MEFENETHFFAGLSEDLSCGGLFIATYCKLPVGTRLWVRFVLPDGTEVSASGSVRWLRDTDTQEAPPGMGVEFVGISPEALKKITEFCSARPPMLFDL
ncbi:MAG: TIGR02266 family protein [Polyangiaceae bacterium]|nr:TIGR02266 family protein [Polyangiaceae bacterium]